MHEKPRHAPATPAAKIVAPRDAKEAAAVLQEANRRREELDLRIWQNAPWVSNMIQNPKEADKLFAKRFGEAPLQILQGVSAVNDKIINGKGGLRETLLPQIKNEDVKERLDEIMRMATAKPPAFGEEPEDELARLVTMTTYQSKTTEDPSPLYQLRTGALRAKQEFLQTLIDSPAYGPQRDDLRKLQACLKDLEKMDPLSVQGYEWRNRPKGAMDQGIGHMAKLVALVGFTAMFLVNGTLALANRKLTLVPFIYLALMYAIAKPEQIKALFGPKAERELLEAGKTLKDKSFEDICAQHDLKGADWARAVRAMMEDRPVTEAALKAARSGKNVGDKEIDEFLKKFEKQPAIQQTLKAMLATPAAAERGAASVSQFAAFLQALLRVKSEEPQRLVEEYVRQGMWKGRGALPPVLPAS